MPRRISDYPDAFTGWNFISSIGSIISVAATALFLHIVYLQLVKGKAIFGYPWAVPQLFSDYLRILKDKCAPGLEWALSNPPKPHAFTSLPLQSSGNGAGSSSTGGDVTVTLPNGSVYKGKQEDMIFWKDPETNTTKGGMIRNGSLVVLSVISAILAISLILVLTDFISHLQPLVNTCVECDAPRAWGLYFQDSASPQMEALVELHEFRV